jgi:hypothetical protein
MRKLAASAPQNGMPIASRGKQHPECHVLTERLIDFLPQARVCTLVHPRDPPHHNRASPPLFLPPPPSAHRRYRPNAKNAGLSDRKRSASTSSELIPMLPNLKPTGSSALVVTNGSGCVATPVTALSHGKHTERAASPRKGEISRYLKFGQPLDPVLSAQRPVLKVETDRRLCENCDNWIVFDRDDREADAKWSQHKLDCARTALASSHVATKRHKTDSPTYVYLSSSGPLFSGLI